LKKNKKIKEAWGWQRITVGCCR